MGAAWGIFGAMNASTSFAQIHDGTSNTIMTGELQRIPPSGLFGGSHDGWAVGGDATGFTTGTPNSSNAAMSNGFFSSPGSDHSNGANFGMADGSVKFLSSGIDANVFALLGSMNDGIPAMLPNE
jgi:prepilin-type processing-associated H-X9-DG protein